MVYRWLDLALDRLMPPACLCCGDRPAPSALCPACHAGLPWLDTGCPRCALPLPVSALCPACLRRPPPWRSLHALCRYAPPVDHLLTGLKFGGRLAVARLCGELLAGHLPHDLRVDALVPVPLHPARLATRGFNQALELARPLAAALDRPLLTAALVRTRDTPPQLGLSARARRRNLRHAFRAASRVPRRVLVVDDVVTTGSTVTAVARCLRAAGAREVTVVAVARTAG